MSQLQPKILEPQCVWTEQDIADPSTWIVQLSDADLAEIDAALATAKTRSEDFLSLTKEDFPLSAVATKLTQVEAELMNGKGFTLIRGLPREQYSNDELCLIYWGMGMYLGKPWPQNKHGHLLGDVTDQGRSPTDPTARGYELGEVALPFHCDGSDLVGLLCLDKGRDGGESAIANSVAAYNRMVEERPDLAAELFKPLPYDYRGEEAPGSKGWYTMPVFTEFDNRLFVRYIPSYIRASQRHEDAPRLTPKELEAMDYFEAIYNDPKYHVYMQMQPGDMQFINNYHVLHGRKAYSDAKAEGKVRHLKRLWLETTQLQDRPAHFTNFTAKHWGDKPTISRMDAERA